MKAHALVAVFVSIFVLEPMTFTHGLVMLRFAYVVLQAVRAVIDEAGGPGRLGCRRPY